MLLVLHIIQYICTNKTLITMENTDEPKTMETNPKVSVFKNSVKYGLYTGIAYILLCLLLWALNVPKMSWLNYLTFIVLIVGVILATINYRNKINDGFISYGKALATGVYVCVIAGVLVGIYTYLFYSFIYPEGIQEMLDLAEEQLVEKGFSDDMIDKQLSMTRKFSSIPIMSISSFIGTIIWGTIFSLVTSAILKKNDNSFDATFPQ